MTFFEQLKAPFSPEKISWRVGATNKEKTKGMALAFIDARDVMERLDEICGPSGWQCRYPHANGKTVCEVGILVHLEETDAWEWLWKADGAGDSDVEAEKGALSDAFKRAAVRWGIGRYLYDVASPWVELDERKQIKQSEYAKLEKLLGGKPAAPAKAAKPSAPSQFYTLALETMKLSQTKADLNDWLSKNKLAVDQLEEDEKARLRKEYADLLQSLPIENKEMETA